VFSQTFEIHDLVIVAVLVVLEGVLSIDNALVLGLLARRVPKTLQGKALTFGLVGALVFRLIAVATAAYLLHWRWVKLLGGLYLLYVAFKHFFIGDDENEDSQVALDSRGRPILVDEDTGRALTGEELGEEMFASTHGRLLEDNREPTVNSKRFWMTVGAIELTDIAFAVDSIVAAIGVVGPPPTGATRHPKLWVVFTGGMLGVILMRFAAVIFIRLLERFPRFETSAYLLVAVIGAKLALDWLFNTTANPDRLNLHSPSSPGFWIFWIAMLAAFLFGFLPSRNEERQN
jgi:YkoY family integral membrane protein